MVKPTKVGDHGNGLYTAVKPRLVVSIVHPFAVRFQEDQLVFYEGECVVRVERVWVLLAWCFDIAADDGEDGGIAQLMALVQRRVYHQQQPRRAGSFVLVRWHL